MGNHHSSSSSTTSSSSSTNHSSSSSFAQENTLLKPQGGDNTWSDSTPVVSACSSMSRLQSMLVAVKQSPRSTMSTFNTSVTEALCLLGGAWELFVRLARETRVVPSTATPATVPTIIAENTGILCSLWRSWTVTDAAQAMKQLSQFLSNRSSCPRHNLPM